MTTFIAACIQTNSRNDLPANLAAAHGFIREAAGRGAQFITLPENVFFMQEPGKGPPPSPDEAVAQSRALARELKVWLLLGTVHAPASGGKSWNRSLLIDASGNLVASYDKIHLFDVTLAGGETYSESARFQGGAEAVIAATPWGTLGMTVCYDVRFPQLYRTLAQSGAEILSVPSAFTYTTGSAHWHSLLKARAVENGCFVIAPAQCGMHPGNRRTYGHSLIVSPWGEILAEADGETPGVITASIGMDKVREARAMIPSLRHDRVFALKHF